MVKTTGSGDTTGFTSATHPNITVKVVSKTKPKSPKLSRKEQGLLATSKSTLENAGQDGRPRHVFITATGKVKLRRKRVPLEQWQKDILEKAFVEGSIPSGRAGKKVIQLLAQKTDLTTQKVAKWVENRYAKKRLLARRKLLLNGYAPDVYKARLTQKAIEELAQKNHDLARKAVTANKSRQERAKARGRAVSEMNNQQKVQALNTGETINELKLNPLQSLNPDAEYSVVENVVEVPSTTTGRLDYVTKFLQGKLKPAGAPAGTDDLLPWSDSSNAVFTDPFMERLTRDHFWMPFKTVEAILEKGELAILQQHMELTSAGLRLALVHYWLAKLGERTHQKSWRCFEFILRSVTNTTHLNKSIPELFAENLDSVKASMIRHLPYDKNLKDANKLLSGSKNKFKLLGENDVSL